MKPTRYLLILSLGTLLLGTSCSKDTPKTSTDTTDITRPAGTDDLFGDWAYEVSILEDYSPEVIANAPKDFTSILQIKLSFRKGNGVFVTITNLIHLQGKTYSRRAIFQGKYQLQGDRVTLTAMEVLQRMEAIPELGLDTENEYIDLAQDAVLRWSKHPEQLTFLSEDNHSTPGSSSEGGEQVINPVFTRQK